MGGLLQSDPQCWLLFVPPEFSFPTGDLSVCGTSLGVGQRGQQVAASLTLTLLMWSFLVPKVQGMLWPHPCVLGFSQWCLVLQQMFVVVVKGVKSGTRKALVVGNLDLIPSGLGRHLGEGTRSLPSPSFRSGVGGTQETRNMISARC